MKLFDTHRVNIVEIYHQRVFTSLPAKDAEIEVECEARDAAQISRLSDALHEAGFVVTRWRSNSGADRFRSAATGKGTAP